MVRFYMFILGLVLTFMMLVGCSPKTTHTTATVPKQPAPIPVTQATATTTAASPQEAAWVKVVEAAKREGKLTVYTVSLTGDAALAVSSSFKARYGVKVDIITGGGSALVERIKTEKRVGTMVADIMDANTFQIGNIKDIGATISADDLPALKEKGVWRVDPWANDPEKHKLIYTLIYSSIVANTSLLKSSDEPRSVKELALPKWKGKITAFDPRQNSSGYNYFLPLLKRKLIDLDTLQAIGRNDIGWTPTANDAVNNLIRGQYPLHFGAGGSVCTTLVTAEPTLPVKQLNMAEGVVISNTAIALVKDGPHPNAAKLWVNWYFEPEGQKEYGGVKGLVPVRKDVPDFTPEKLRMTPTNLIVPSAEEEVENLKRFQEGYLAKLWGR